MEPDTSRYTSPFHRVARFIAQRGVLKPVVYGMTKVTVRGKENLKGLNPPCIVVANHSSHLDAPLIMTSLPYRFTKDLSAGAAADYFFDVWWRRGFTALMFNAFPVNRDPRRKGAGMSMRLLRKGVPLLIFPEGTRSRTGKMGKFTTGAAGLSLQTGAPCVPIALVGAAKAMPVGKLLPQGGRPRILVKIGSPMWAHQGETLKEFSARIEAEIRAMLAAEGQELVGELNLGEASEADEAATAAAREAAKAALRDAAKPGERIRGEVAAPYQDAMHPPLGEARRGEDHRPDAEVIDLATGAAPIEAQPPTPEQIDAQAEIQAEGDGHVPSPGELEPAPYEPDDETAADQDRGEERHA